MVDDLPKKPSKWTRAFLQTQHPTGGGAAGGAGGWAGGGAAGGSGAGGAAGGAGGSYAAFQMPRFHKKRLLKEVLKRMTGE